MSCWGCDDFEAGRSRHSFTAECRECRARALAQGPAFHARNQDAYAARLYREALKAMLGPDWKAGHESVKAWRAKIAAQLFAPAAGCANGVEA